MKLVLDRDSRFRPAAVSSWAEKSPAAAKVKLSDEGLAGSGVEEYLQAVSGWISHPEYECQLWLTKAEYQKTKPWISIILVSLGAAKGVIPATFQARSLFT